MCLLVKDSNSSSIFGGELKLRTLSVQSFADAEPKVGKSFGMVDIQVADIPGLEFLSQGPLNSVRRSWHLGNPN
jgi:hypothetical protein